MLIASGLHSGIKWCIVVIKQNTKYSFIDLIIGTFSMEHSNQGAVFKGLHNKRVESNFSKIVGGILQWRNGAEWGPQSKEGFGAPFFFE